MNTNATNSIRIARYERAHANKFVVFVCYS